MDTGPATSGSGNSRETSVESDSQRQGLLENNGSGDGAAHQSHPALRSFSQSDGNRPTSSSASLATPNTSLTFLNCLALVVSIQIGSGIFSAPAIVSNHVPGPAAGILVWAVAGLLVWTGASCFIELGLSIPRNGGMQEYLRCAYGDFAGFMFSCIWLSIVRPCSIAMIAMIFAQHFNGIVLQVLGLRGGWVLDKLVALLGVLAITGLNCVGVQTGASVAIWFLVLKLFIVSSIVLAGIIVAVREKGGYLFEGVEDARQATRVLKLREMVDDKGARDAFGEYVIAGFAALWVYGGWETVGFVVGEMRDPIKDLPRVIRSSMMIAFTSFTLLVTALYIILPMSTIRENNTPVVTLGNSLYGSIGGLFYTIVICLSALGSMNANVFAIGRLAAAAAERGYIPQIFAGHKNTGMSAEEEEAGLRASMQKHWPALAVLYVTKCVKATARLRLEEGVPLYAMLLNALLAAMYILLGTFRGLITFIGITEYFIFIPTVLALFRLRSSVPLRRTSSSPNLSSASPPKTYRTNIINPIIFCVLSASLVGRGVLIEPAQGVALLSVFASLMAWWWWKKKKQSVTASLWPRRGESLRMDVT